MVHTPWSERCGGCGGPVYDGETMFGFPGWFDDELAWVCEDCAQRRVPADG